MNVDIEKIEILDLNTYYKEFYKLLNRHLINKEEISICLDIFLFL